MSKDTHYLIGDHAIEPLRKATTFVLKHMQGAHVLRLAGDLSDSAASARTNGIIFRPMWKENVLGKLGGLPLLRKFQLYDGDEKRRCLISSFRDEIERFKLKKRLTKTGYDSEIEWVGGLPMSAKF